MINPDNIIYLPNTLVRCGNCDHKFRSPESFSAPQVNQSNQATQIVSSKKFTCPNCGTTDYQWVYCKDQNDVVLPTCWLAAEKKRGWYCVYLVTRPPLGWSQVNPTARMAMVKRFGSEIARFKHQGNAFAYAREQAQSFGKTNPEYFAIVTI